MMTTVTLPERDGYAFVGYYTSTGGGGTKYYNYQGLPLRVWQGTGTTLYAYWTPVSYTATGPDRNQEITSSGWTNHIGSPYGPSNGFNVKLLKEIGYTWVQIKTGHSYARTYWKSGIWPFQTTHNSGNLRLGVFAGTG